MTSINLVQFQLQACVPSHFPDRKVCCVCEFFPDGGFLFSYIFAVLSLFCIQWELGYPDYLATKVV